MRRLHKVLLVVLSIVLFVGMAQLFLHREEQPYRTTAFAMDTFIEITFYGRQAENAAQELLKRLHTLENHISLYESGSEIAALNRNAGTTDAVALSEDTYRLLRQTRVFSLQFQGVFDITVAPLSTLWDVTSAHPHVPEQNEIAKALALVSAGDLLLDDTTHTARLRRSGQGVDLGGIAKGFATSTVFDVMDEFGIENGFASLGGNMAVRGKKPGTGGDFKIGVRDPRGDASEYLGVITLAGQTMATTGDYERYFEKDGVRYHHVMDPSTGYPAWNGLISVTAVSPDGTLADMLSTALFVAGKDEVLAYHMNRADAALIAVDNDRNVYCSAMLQDVFEPNPEKDYRFHFVG